MTELSQAEIKHLQALRAKNLAIKSPTMPTKAWDNQVDNPGGEGWDNPPMSVVEKAWIESPAPRKLRSNSDPTPVGVIAARCFTGNLNASDLRFMALALLQMQDEVCELRERVRKCEGPER